MLFKNSKFYSFITDIPEWTFRTLTFKIYCNIPILAFCWINFTFPSSKCIHYVIDNKNFRIKGSVFVSEALELRAGIAGIRACSFRPHRIVEFRHGVIIQRGILTQGQNSTWNFEPGSQFNVEFWPVYISSTRGIATQDGVKIQQRDQNSTAKEGHNSTKNPLNIDPGSVFNRGGQNFILHRPVFGLFVAFWE